MKIILVFLLTFCLVGGSGASLAQELRVVSSDTETVLEQPAIPLTTLDANTIPSEKVSQFVQAYLQVLDLIDQRQGELQAAETELESLRLEREIETEATAIIEQTGITRQEYLQLLSLANIDPEFGERIADQLQEATN